MSVVPVAFVANPTSCGITYSCAVSGPVGAFTSCDFGVITGTMA